MLEVPRGAVGGTRRGLMMWRSALRADSAAMLATQGRLRYRRRGAGRAATSRLLAGPSPAAPDFPLRRCASRRPINRPHRVPPAAQYHRAVRRRIPQWCWQSRGWVCAGSDICGAEERKTHGRARSALQPLTRRDCLSVATAGRVASFSAGHEAEHRREPLAQRGAAASERRRTPARGFARSARSSGLR